MAISAALRLGFRHQTQKYVDVTKPYSKMLLGVRYHKTRRKIQMAVVHRMSELQVQPLLLSWSIITLSLAHPVTNKFFSFKKRAWVMTSLCPLSRYRPLSLITSHTMTSVSWNRESVSMGLALVSAKLLPWDWKDYLRALSHSESKGWFMQVKGAVRLRNVASSQPETLLLFLISQDSSLEQLYQCPTPACSPCCSPSPGAPQLLLLPSSGYGQRPHLKPWTFQWGQPPPWGLSVKCGAPDVKASPLSRTPACPRGGRTAGL